MCDEHLIELVTGEKVDLGKHGVHPSQIRVGRTLTLERVLQMNSRTYFYAMLKDNPELTAIYPGIENDILAGAIDCHIHAFPDFVNRSQDMLEIAVAAAQARMRAVYYKDHWNLTANAAYLVQRYVDELHADGRLEHRVEVYGGLGLNHGVNPEAVKIALQYPCCRILWFPTFKSYGWARFAGIENREGYVRLVDDGGTVLPEVRAVFELAAEADVLCSLGHTDFEELLPLCTLARELGVKTLLDHPLLELNKLLVDEMRQLADLGTYVGTYCQPMIPSLYQPVCDPFETVDTIRAIGAERCVAGSDFGQVLHVNTVDGMRIFIRALLGFGISPEDVTTIVRDNPAKLLGLEPLEA
ncbi:MAG TPA: DUF6282 family protein [Gaiellaceae bacterium]|nr:DUF6282 family protein [Gaiellaceae bacterium]